MYAYFQGYVTNVKRRPTEANNTVSIFFLRAMKKFDITVEEIRAVVAIVIRIC